MCFIHYIAKSIGTPLQIIDFRCSNHYHDHRCIKSSTWACRLLRQTFLKEWELSEFKRGTVIGCRLCNESICQISSLLSIPRSTVCGIMTKWKQLGATATQPQSVRLAADAEAHSEQKSPTFCRVSSYRPPNFVWQANGRVLAVARRTLLA